MSDAQTRDLERAWRESGNAQDKAAWIQARLRAGELDPARLAVATFARDPGALALRALSQTAPRPGAPVGPPSPPPVDAAAQLVAATFGGDAWAAWSGALVRLGWETALRAGVADMRHKQDLLEAEIGGAPLSHGHLEACRTVLARRAELLEDWILAGGPQASMAELLSDPAFSDPTLSMAMLGRVLEPPGAHSRIYASALQRSNGLSRALRVGLGDLGGLGLHVGWSLGDSAQDAALLARIEAELAAWALGTADPLTLRLERLEIASPCPKTWEQLSGDSDAVRDCADCGLSVYDLSALTRADGEALLREREGRACVRILRRADGRIQTRDCPVGLQRKLEPYQMPPPQLLGALPIA